jgi:hypothetical protein
MAIEHLPTPISKISNGLIDASFSVANTFGTGELHPAKQQSATVSATDKKVDKRSSVTTKSGKN